MDYFNVLHVYCSLRAADSFISNYISTTERDKEEMTRPTEVAFKVLQHSSGAKTLL